MSGVADERPSIDLLQAFRTGSESAAAELFDRYVDRLTGLARARLSARLRRRIDPEDVVLSTYRSFFVAARRGRYELAQSGDLWRLLARMTLNKLARQAARHQADKRSVADEASLPATPLSRDPTPDEAVALADELEALMQGLTPLPRRVLELRLQGHTHEEIAADIDRTTRTVRRMLSEIRASIATEGGFALKGGSMPPEDPPRASAPQLFPAEGIRELVADYFRRRGERAFSDFLLQQHLGTGASGKVYRAQERPTGRTVALKFLRKDVLAEESIVRRFVEEADIIASLDHPGIVQTYGFGRTPIGGFFLVQEFHDGPSLQERLPSAVQAAVDWVIQAAQALQHAHDQGVIHCDLKPGNLLLGGDGHIRVTDFGLAQRSDPSRRELPALAGTLGYMAPEQVDPVFGAVGPANDVYGLGATLYALLSGRPPIAGDRVSDVLAAIVAGPPVRTLNAVRADIPDAVSAVVDRCLSRNIDRRPQTATALAEELRNSLQ